MNWNQVEKIFLGLLLVISSNLAVGQKQPFVADTQRFGVRLFLVPDADAFVEMWSKLEPPKLTFFNKVKVNSQFAGAILYWGGGIGSDGNCNIILKTQIMQNDEVLAYGPEMPICQGHPPPPAGVLALSDTIIDLHTAGEPANLIVQVTATDQVNNETLVVEAPIQVVAK